MTTTIGAPSAHRQEDDGAPGHDALLDAGGIVVAPAQSTERHLRWIVALMTIAAIAFTARLVPLLRGGGLFGVGNYDDGVYYAAATALVHGQLPYRDFLLLHPPGITIVLAPFALLGRLTSDADGFAVARLAWMLLGAANAVLVCRIVRPLGPAGAAAGGLFYALFQPAVYTEHTTMLEAPANTALLIAILLVNRLQGHREGAWPRRPMLFTAGAMLGLSAGMKIWGVVVIVLFVGWELVTRGIRPIRWLMLGVVAGGLALYLPFFVQAPTVMWNEVARDQLGRSSSVDSAVTRLAYLTGLGSYHPAHPSFLMTATVVAVLVLAMSLAWFAPQARLAVVLFVGLALFLLLIPIWFSHYAGLIGPAAAIVTGAGTAQLIVRIRMMTSQFMARALSGLTALAAVTGLCFSVVSLTHSSWGQRFPAAAFATTAESAPGCVTTDDPIALIETNTLSRNLARGCRTVVDLGGYVHDDRAATHTTGARRHDKMWQSSALAYLQSGSAAFVVRFAEGDDLDTGTRATLNRWPVLARAGAYALRSPRP